MIAIIRNNLKNRTDIENPSLIADLFTPRKQNKSQEKFDVSGLHLLTDVWCSGELRWQ